MGTVLEPLNWSKGVLLDAPGGLLQRVGFAGFSAAAPEHQQGKQHGDEDQSGDDCVGSGQVGSEVQPVVHRPFAAFALGQRAKKTGSTEVRSKTSSTGVTAMYHPVELVSSGKAAAVMRKEFEAWTSAAKVALSTSRKVALAK